MWDDKEGENSNKYVTQLNEVGNYFCDYNAYYTSEAQMTVITNAK